LKNRFYLTALEFYTELLENGYDLPRLREYFSNPANFEGSSSATLNKQSSFIRNLNHYADDSVSLGGGGNGDYVFRTSSSQTFDSTSIDNITRYSEDIDWNNGNGSGGAMTSASGIGELRFNDERVAVLEFELRKARDTIQELRQTLTYDSADEQQQQHNKKSEERNGKYQGELKFNGDSFIIGSDGFRGRVRWGHRALPPSKILDPPLIIGFEWILASAVTTWLMASEKKRLVKFTVGSRVPRGKKRILS